MRISNHTLRLTLFFLLVLACLPARALEVTYLSIAKVQGGEHVSLGFDAPARPKVFMLDNPPRVVVDLPVAHWNGRVGVPQNYNGTLVKNVRYGFHNAGTKRLVLDLTADATLHNAGSGRSQETGGYSLEFDLAGHGVRQAHPAIASEPEETEPAENHKHQRAASSEPTRRTEKPVIVIDAGHGGQDPGTSGHGGTEEKNVTLRYAHALKDALARTGYYRVVLTRDDDRYLFLRDRVKRARAAHGDLFISLHADSAPTRSVRGLSVYTISEKASDKEAELLAAQENKADVIGGMDLSDTSQDVADILIDLAQRETREKSAKFADLAVKDLGREVHLLSNTHRFAGFAVLKAPDIPSVLIEIGFLTTPHEEELLRSPTYQGKVVRGLVKAVDSYFAKNKK